MLPRSLAIVLGCVLSTTALAQVDYGFDPQADLTGMTGIAWVSTPSTSIERAAPQLHERVVATIEKKMTSGKLRRVDEAAELFVTYHTRLDGELRLSVHEFGYLYSKTWDAVAGTTTRDVEPSDPSTGVLTYPRGTLVIDVWDAAGRQLIFRGAAADVFAENPDEFDASMMRAIRKITAQFKKVHKSWNRRKRATRIGGIDWPV